MIYMFLANGFEEIEALATLDILRRAELEVTTVGVGGKFITGAHKITVMADVVENDLVCDEKLECVILPGGMPGTLNLEKSSKVNEFVDYAFSNNILIGAICAAPSILGHKGLLKKKIATCYDGFEQELNCLKLSKDYVCVSDIVTAKGAGVALEFGFKIAEILAGEKMSKKVRESYEMHPIDIRKYKIELREKAKTSRKSMKPEEKKVMDSDIAERVRKLYQYRAAKVILVYVSTPIEIDTFKIIENAYADGKKVAVPRCIPQTRKMEFHYINSVDELSVGSFSVLEPPEDFPVVTDYSAALMLVPGFMFDHFGYRLGYGKGYYDRYLSRYNGAAVGLCYSDEFKRHMYHGRYDRTVDTLVSEKWIRRCKKYSR